MEIKIRKIQNSKSKVKAFASVTMNLGKGDLTINSIKIIEGEQGLFIAFPSTPSEVDGETKYYSIVYAEPKLKEVFESKVLGEYKKACANKSKNKKDVIDSDNDLPF